VIQTIKATPTHRHKIADAACGVLAGNPSDLRCAGMIERMKNNTDQELTVKH